MRYHLIRSLKINREEWFIGTVREWKGLWRSAKVTITYQLIRSTGWMVIVRVAHYHSSSSTLSLRQVWESPQPREISGIDISSNRILSDVDCDRGSGFG